MGIRKFSVSRQMAKALGNILTTACIVAVVDGLAAVLTTHALYDRPPLFVFQYIASGVEGTAAFSGGIRSGLWGMVYHFIISLAWTSLFFIVHRPISRIIPRLFLRTILYACVIWLVMNLLVLPLSQVPSAPLSIKD